MENKDVRALDSRTCISYKTIGKETEGYKKCKHNWVIHEKKFLWWSIDTLLYCSKCGSWKKI